MTQKNGHRINFIVDAEQIYREACWDYLHLAFNEGGSEDLQVAARAMAQARKAYVR